MRKNFSTEPPRTNPFMAEQRTSSKGRKLSETRDGYEKPNHLSGAALDRITERHFGFTLPTPTTDLDTAIEEHFTKQIATTASRRKRNIDKRRLLSRRLRETPQMEQEKQKELRERLALLSEEHEQLRNETFQLRKQQREQLAAFNTSWLEYNERMNDEELDRRAV